MRCFLSVVISVSVWCYTQGNRGFKESIFDKFSECPLHVQQDGLLGDPVAKAECMIMCAKRPTCSGISFTGNRNCSLIFNVQTTFCSNASMDKVVQFIRQVSCLFQDRVQNCRRSQGKAWETKPSISHTVNPFNVCTVLKNVAETVVQVRKGQCAISECDVFEIMRRDQSRRSRCSFWRLFDQSRQLTSTHEGSL